MWLCFFALEITTAGATAHQLPTEIHDDQQETVNTINQQIQPIGTSAVADSGISSFSLMHETLHECSTLSYTIQKCCDSNFKSEFYAVIDGTLSATKIKSENVRMTSTKLENYVIFC
jgi:hypothetical protein